MYVALTCPPVFQLNISFPATGCQKLIEVDDERKLRTFYEKRMATEVAADPLGDEWKVSCSIILVYPSWVPVVCFFSACWRYLLHVRAPFKKKNGTQQTLSDWSVVIKGGQCVAREAAELLTRCNQTTWPCLIETATLSQLHLGLWKWFKLEMKSLQLPACQ